MTADHNDAVATLSAGYACEGPSIRLGRAMLGGSTCEADIAIPLAVCNRHGLIAGATGTGKTKTLQVMAEQFSAAGVPVFLADFKGDLSGLAAPGQPHPKIDERTTATGGNWSPQGYPVEFFNLGGRGEGAAIRCTVTAFGPDLLAKTLGLTDVQTSSLKLIFHYADTAGLALVDLEDLRAVVHYLVSAEGKEDLAELGGISKATAGVILRELVAFAADGAGDFFGEPQFETEDFVRTTADGQGVISCLSLAEVSRKPALFSSFLMWLLADLFDVMPEVGDPEKPSLVFFFDEAHLLFDDAPKHLVEQIGHTVRLIRSKGVGIFFVTQSPADLPEEVLGQLGSRVQHALRAFTPKDAANVKAAAATYPVSDIYDVPELLTSVGIGEAVVTVLDSKGVPSPVAHTMLPAPTSLMAPAPADVIAERISSSELAPRYNERVDPESAVEMLAARSAPPEPTEAVQAQPEASGKTTAAESPHADESPQESGGGLFGSLKATVGGVFGSTAFKSFARTAGREIGREITRSVLGTGRSRRH